MTFSRLIDSYSPEIASRDLPIETIEILSDAELMRWIARGRDDIEAGRIKSLDQVSMEIN